MEHKKCVKITQMKVLVKVKNLSDKSAKIKESFVKLRAINRHCSLEELLTEIVKYEVGKFRLRQNSDDVMQQLTNGKITFNSIFNKSKVDIEESIKIAITAYKDGLFSVFLNDEEVKSLNSEIYLDSKSVLTFIKLTFLTGTYW